MENYNYNPEQLAIIEQQKRDNFLNDLRVKRNQLLEETDWTVLYESPLNPSKIQEYRQYRQALRDLTQTATYDNTVWPVKPS
jgi:hypothetical protein